MKSHSSSQTREVRELRLLLSSRVCSSPQRPSATACSGLSKIGEKRKTSFPVLLGVGVSTERARDLEYGINPFDASLLLYKWDNIRDSILGKLRASSAGLPSLVLPSVGGETVIKKRSKQKNRNVFCLFVLTLPFFFLLFFYLQNLGVGNCVTPTESFVTK